MRNLLAILTATVLLQAAFAHAQFRILPANAKRATIGQQQFVLPYVNIGGAAVKLAPGGVIYDQDNRFILHEALPPGADVVYSLDINGDIGRIYILTPQEQATFVQQP